MARFLLAPFLIFVLGANLAAQLATPTDWTENVGTADAFSLGYAHRARAG
jgi:hypothetical protein